MARYFDVHPENPQARDDQQGRRAVAGRRAGRVPDRLLLRARAASSATPTGIDRIRTIRDLESQHHFTLVCGDFAQLGQFVHLDNAVFRAVRAATPGPYTFILPATREVPRRMMHPKKRTVGVRIPAHRTTHALVEAMGEPLLSSTLLMPGDEKPMTQGWEIKERLDHLVDAVLDSGDCGEVPTTVVDFSSGAAEVVRVGAGDPARFE